MDELNVKVGDNVLYKGGRERIESIRKVTKITPTGRIRISGSDSQFNKYGDEMGHSDDWSPRHYISVPTKEDIVRVERNNAIRKAVFLCKEVNGENITYEQVGKLIDILETKSEK